MVVQITWAAELAGVIAAQVVTMRSDGAVTIYGSVVVDYAVLERGCSAINDAASRISADGAVIHCEGPRAIDDSTTRARACSRTAVGAIPCDGAIVQRHGAAKGVERATLTHLAGKPGAARSVCDIGVESAVLNHHQRALVVDAAPKSRAGICVAASTRLVSGDRAVANGEGARIVDTTT